MGASDAGNARFISIADGAPFLFSEPSACVQPEILRALILLLNDDAKPMDFVVDVIEQVFDVD